MRDTAKLRRILFPWTRHAGYPKGVVVGKTGVPAHLWSIQAAEIR